MTCWVYFFKEKKGIRRKKSPFLCISCSLKFSCLIFKIWTLLVVISTSWDELRVLHSGNCSAILLFPSRPITLKSYVTERGTVALVMLSLNCCRLGACSVYTVQPVTRLKCHFTWNHVDTCVFNRNKPPAFLAEWPRSFMCYCSNMGMEQIWN